MGIGVAPVNGKGAGREYRLLERCGGRMLSNGFCREGKMKTRVSLLVAVMTVFMAAGSAFAQQAAPAASAPPDLSPVANPVSGFVKAGVARYEKNMMAAAEATPAEKDGLKPSPELNSFGHR